MFNGSWVADSRPLMFPIFTVLAVMWNVITVSLRQTIIPDQPLGRANRVYRFFAWGMMPVGAFLGGALVTVTEAVAVRDWRCACRSSSRRACN